MNRSITRWAALGAATMVGAAVLSPLGGLAHAATGTSVYYYVASKSGAPAALYNRVSGAKVSPAGATVKDLRASRDGTRLVDLEAALDGNGNQVQSIRVYDVSGHALSTVASIASDVGSLFFPNISPDGSAVAWSRQDSSGTRLYVKTLATGVTTLLGSDLYQPVFASSTRLIVRDVNGLGYWMPVSGGTPTHITTFPEEAVGMTISPDGTKISWEHELGTVPATADIYVAQLTVDGSGVSLGSVASWIKIATGKDNYAPAFTRAGTKVLFINADNETIGYGQVMAAPVDGSSSPVVVDGTDLVKVVTQAVGEAAPAVPLPQPVTRAATLGGTAARVYWTNPADSRVSQIQVKRYLGSASTPQKTVYVPLPAFSYLDTGLTVGSRYRYTFASVDRSGNVAASPVTRWLLAAGAAPSASDPTSRTTTQAPFSVRFGPGSPGVIWNVDYRVNSAATWTPWVSGRAGTVRTFGSAAATGIAATTSVPGRTYQFRARARDGYGNSTATVTGAATVVPYNQSSAILAGGTTVYSASAWLGSYRRLTATSQYARITLTGNRLQVVAWRCVGCGSFAIYEGSTKIATVKTYWGSTIARSVVFTKYWSTTVTRTVTIRPLGTAGHPAVLLDGFAMRR
jgi:hypothetical protein